MRYGFAIDQRTCIGCHACTVACKTEHQIPVGQFRTWVKYVDSGRFPNSTRDFAVLRCNHCTDAPCVRICPTKALFTRDDGIVDFDSERCIGCKSCLQGCPYDAIYLDEQTHTAAKCNFCAHRIDQNLEPACVVVCPTHSIWVGDLDDPDSGISKLITTNPVTVRAPEQHTGPNVFYLGADRAVLDPLAAPANAGYLYSTPDPHRAQVAQELPGDPVTHARTTLNTAHPRPWGWRVITYLWTKALAAGVMLLASLAQLIGVDLAALGEVLAPALGVAGVAVTGVLLVADLKRPERFWFIFAKPNFRSWLFWGSIVLAAAAGLFGLWLLAGLLSATGALSPGTAGSILTGLALPTFLVAALTTSYTAFLFGQAEGRDLWQSPLLFWHLLVQAFMVGAGAMVIAAMVLDVPGPGRALLVGTLVLGTLGHIAMVLVEYLGRHPSANAAAAARLARSGRYATTFWAGGIALAVLAAALGALGWVGPLAAAAAAGALVQVALLAYESVFIRAGQDVPLS